MDIKWKKPQNLPRRLIQTLSVAGAAGLVGAGILSYGGQYRAVSVSPLSPETAMETAGSASSNKKTKKEVSFESEARKSAQKETAVQSETQVQEKDTAKGEGKMEAYDSQKYFKIQDPESGEEVLAEYAPPGGGESLTGYLLVEKVPEETSEELVQYELVPSTDADTADPSEGKTERGEDSTAEFQGDSYQKPGVTMTAPYANPLEYLPSINRDVVGILQFQPIYLKDLTQLSLSWTQLERELTKMLDSYSGDWSVCVIDLSNQNTITINSHPMESASLIKLYIMGAVMEQIHLGNLEETSAINSLLNDMITVSDNESSNELVRYLDPDHNHKKGMDVLNDFAKRHGYLDTQQINGLADTSLWVDSNKRNETSVADCAKLLSDIYEGSLVSHMASRMMESLLLGQQIRYKIPGALPSGAICANKTGEVDGVENDSSIIYSKGGDFVLCIMSGEWSSGNTAIDHIHDITKLVYSYFNPVKNTNEATASAEE